MRAKFIGARRNRQCPIVMIGIASLAMLSSVACQKRESIPEQRTRLVAALVERGKSALARADAKAAYWPYQFAAWYAPGDTDIASALKSMRVPEEPRSADEAAREFRPIQRGFVKAVEIGLAAGNPGAAYSFADEPLPDPAVDVLNLKMLLDQKLTGDLRLTAQSSLQKRDGVATRMEGQAFLSPPSTTVSEVQRLYGQPTSKPNGGSGDILTYGRLRMIAEKDGTVVFVIFRAFESPHP